MREATSPFSRFVFGLAFLVLTAVLIPTAQADVALLDPLTQPKFINPLPNPLDPTFIFNPVEGTNHYDIGIYEFDQNLGLYDPETGDPLSTTVWGYGYASDLETGELIFDPDSATYPGRTFVAQSDEPIEVDWYNFLYDPDKDEPLPHLLQVDTSIHWAGMEGQVYQGISPLPNYELNLYAYDDVPADGVPVVTHLHGGHTDSSSDGLPDAWFTPNIDGANPEYNGRLYNPNYYYDNSQPAATLWYHDHALGITRLNVYAGLAGFYLLRDDIDTGSSPDILPAYPYEVPLVIQDRMFTAEGDLYYPSMSEVPDAPDPSVLPEFFGDTILVNGEAWPILEVEPRKYRFRLLNGSDSRFYNLDLPGVEFYQIGTDDGLLPQPVWVNKLLLGPGERADVIVDFSDPELWGDTLIMRNNAKAPYDKGEAADPRTVGQIMAFRVDKPLDVDIPDPPLPTSFGTYTPLVPTSDTPRSLLLFESTDDFGRIQPLLGTTEDGALAWSVPITENPMLNDVEVWQVFNTTVDAHPIHLHLVSFQIVSRQKFKGDQDPESGALTDISYIGQPKPPDPNELGWKDTAVMYPGEVTTIIAKFDKPGEYVWHCHILSHEDHEMMRPYEVIDPEVFASDVTAPEMVALSLPPQLTIINPISYSPAVSSESYLVFGNTYSNTYVTYINYISKDDEKTTGTKKTKNN